MINRFITSINIGLVPMMLIVSCILATNFIATTDFAILSYAVILASTYACLMWSKHVIEHSSNIANSRKTLLVILLVPAASLIAIIESVHAFISLNSNTSYASLQYSSMCSVIMSIATVIFVSKLAIKKTTYHMRVFDLRNSTAKRFAAELQAKQSHFYYFSKLGQPAMPYTSWAELSSTEKFKAAAFNDTFGLSIIQLDADCVTSRDYIRAATVFIDHMYNNCFSSSHITNFFKNNIMKKILTQFDEKQFEDVITKVANAYEQAKHESTFALPEVAKAIKYALPTIELDNSVSIKKFLTNYHYLNVWNTDYMTTDTAKFSDDIRQHATLVHINSMYPHIIAKILTHHLNTDMQCNSEILDVYMYAYNKRFRNGGTANDKQKEYRYRLFINLFYGLSQHTSINIRVSNMSENITLSSEIAQIVASVQNTLIGMNVDTLVLANQSELHTLDEIAPHHDIIAENDFAKVIISLLRGKGDIQQQLDFLTHKFEKYGFATEQFNRVIGRIASNDFEKKSTIIDPLS